MDYFTKPLEVSYKSPNERSPVTDADKASDAYLQAEIQRRFPTHTILSEEGDDDANIRSAVTWVLDPLDGTNNFMNRLPIFGVSIGVLEGDRPVVGALFIPSIFSREGLSHKGGSGEGSVFHARAGGGARCDGAPLTLGPGQKPGNHLLAAVPGYFWRMFNLRPQLRSSVGEMRTTGSVAYELAMTSQGTFQYAVFRGPKLWDVAGGLVVVREAGGSVLAQQPGVRGWQQFERFHTARAQELPTHGELRAWSATLVAGTTEAVAFVAPGLRYRRYRLRRLWRRIRQMLRRKQQPPAGQPQAQQPSAAPSGLEQPHPTGPSVLGQR
jgi:myo-inositol-1(or 4)-monophosphatase